MSSDFLFMKQIWCVGLNSIVKYLCVLFDGVLIWLIGMILRLVLSVLIFVAVVLGVVCTFLFWNVIVFGFDGGLRYVLLILLLLRLMLYFGIGCFVGFLIGLWIVSRIVFGVVVPLSVVSIVVILGNLVSVFCSVFRKFMYVGVVFDLFWYMLISARCSWLLVLFVFVASSCVMIWLVGSSMNGWVLR